MLFVSDSLEYQKTKSSKKENKKLDSKNKKDEKSTKNSKSTKKTKSSRRRRKNSFRRRVDLDVLLRFSFAKYSSNAVAEFVTGILQSIYIPMYKRLKRLSNSKKLIKNHIKCIKSSLLPVFKSPKQSVKFVNSFIKGIRVSSRVFLDKKIFKFSLKTWISSNKVVKVGDKLLKMKYKRLGSVKKIGYMRRVLGRGTWLNVLGYLKFVTKFFRTVWFNSSYITKKVLKCGMQASSRFRSLRKYFIVKYKKTKRVLCNMNPINALVRILRDFMLHSSLDVLFKNIAFKGIKMNKIHQVNWTRIGRSTFIAYQSFLNECPK